MKSEAYLLAKLQGEQQLRSELIGLAQHPIVALIGGVTAIEILRRGQILPDLPATALNVVILSSGLVGQLANASSGIAGALTKIAPLLIK